MQFKVKDSLRSKRSRTKRTKFGPREGVFRIQAARKMRRETPSRDPNFVRFVRERLLRRLTKGMDVNSIAWEK